MSAYACILFDFDGTLVDTLDDIAAHANAVLEERGLPSRGRSQIQAAVGKGVHELFKALAEPFTADAAALEEAVLSFKSRYAAQPVISSRAYPCVREALESWLGPVPKAIVTNKPADLTRSILERLGLARHFPVLVGLGDFAPKPDPAGVFHALEAVGARPERSVLIGDSRVDYETARNAGTAFVWAEYGYDDLSGVSVPSVSSPCQWARALSNSDGDVL